MSEQSSSELDPIPYVDPYLLPRLVNDEPIVQTEQEKALQKGRDMVLRSRCLAMDKIGKPMLTRARELNVRDRRKYNEVVMDIYTNTPEDDIITQFNLLCCDTVLNEASDVSSYSVFQRNL